MTGEQKYPRIGDDLRVASYACRWEFSATIQRQVRKGRYMVRLWGDIHVEVQRSDRAGCFVIVSRDDPRVLEAWRSLWPAIVRGKKEMWMDAKKDGRAMYLSDLPASDREKILRTVERLREEEAKKRW